MISCSRNACRMNCILSVPVRSVQGRTKFESPDLHVCGMNSIFIKVMSQSYLIAPNQKKQKFILFYRSRINNRKVHSLKYTFIHVTFTHIRLRENTHQQSQISIQNSKCEKTFSSFSSNLPITSVSYPAVWSSTIPSRFKIHHQQPHQRLASF